MCNGEATLARRHVAPNRHYPVLVATPTAPAGPGRPSYATFVTVARRMGSYISRMTCLVRYSPNADPAINCLLPRAQTVEEFPL